MRFDKLTTKFQQALADAQSTAAGQDHQFIEPLHLLSALLAQDDSSGASLLSRAGVNVPRLRESIKAAISRLPKVEGHGGEVQVSRELNALFNLTDKEAQKRGDEFIASELFLLAVAEEKGEAGRLLREAGGTRKAIDQAIKAVRGGETVLVHGDYDVDGQCATAIMTRVLRHLGGRAVPFVPHRLRDGYDLSAAGVRAATSASS